MLTQEIMIYLGMLIKSEPQLFCGLMTLRVGYLILLMVTELADDLQVRQEEAYEQLMQLSPSAIRSRLTNVLGDYDDMAKLALTQEALPLQHGIVCAIQPALQKVGAPAGGWLRYRERQGALNRVPAGFYPSIWNLLKHCKGLIIGDKLDLRNRVDSALILSETTAQEKNFALWIEHLLNKMDAVKYRQMNIETMMTLAELAEQSPALMIDDYLVIDIIIGHAVRLAWLDLMPERSSSYEEDKSSAWQTFYEASPQVCAAYTVRALQFLTGSDGN
jgi:phosphorylase kinase alpha/beta subunit